MKHKLLPWLIVLLVISTLPLGLYLKHVRRCDPLKADVAALTRKFERLRDEGLILLQVDSDIERLYENSVLLAFVDVKLTEAELKLRACCEGR